MYIMHQRQTSTEHPGSLLKKNPLKKRKLKGSKQIRYEWTSQQGFGLERHQTTNIDKEVLSTAQTELSSKNEATSQETGGKRNQPVDKGKNQWKTKDKTKQVTDKDRRKKCSQSKSTISSKKLKCTFTNAQSIMSKRDDLQCYIDSEEPDIVGIVETWLDSKVSNAELQIPGYQITRLDRQTGEHGGILL